jgi:hypothetical protein
MKPHLIVFILFFASMGAAAPGAAQTQAPAAGSRYQQFVDQMVTTENVADCIAKMDGLIDDGEQFSADSTDNPRGLNARTNIGLHLAFCIFTNKQEVLYYLIISRDGQELSIVEATKIAALFCDRAGLPHPVSITTGEKPIFYAQWHIKHADWHDLKKMMVQVRAENRSEKDPQKAFAAAIIREINAREAGPVSGP